MACRGVARLSSFVEELLVATALEAAGRWSLALFVLSELFPRLGAMWPFTLLVGAGLGGPSTGPGAQ